MFLEMQWRDAMNLGAIVNISASVSWKHGFSSYPEESYHDRYVRQFIHAVTAIVLCSGT